MNFVCVFVEELSRAEEVSAISAFDPLVRLPLAAAAAGSLAAVLVVARVHLVRRRTAAAMN